MEGEVIVSRQEIWPSGMRVMVIDNNSRYLLHMEKLLLRCNYSVKTCGEIGEAISFVMDNPQSVDLIISDVFLPGDDGLSILKALALEFDFPVIMMSWCGEIGMIMKYIAHGACDFLIKPLRIKEVRNIWQHVFRSQMGYHVNTLYQLNDSSAIAGNVERKRRGISLTSQNINQTITDIRDLKKPRLHWTAHLHQQFVVAVNTLGIDSASPTRILELMKVEQLTREQVASHLQKYRIQMLKFNSSVPVESVESSVVDANGERNDYFMMFEEANPLDPMPSLNHMATTVVGNYCSNGAGESSSSSRCTTDDMNSCFDELNWLQNKEAFDPSFWNMDSSSNDSRGQLIVQKLGAAGPWADRRS